MFFKFFVKSSIQIDIVSHTFYNLLVFFYGAKVMDCE